MSKNKITKDEMKKAIDAEIVAETTEEDVKQSEETKTSKTEVIEEPKKVSKLAKLGKKAKKHKKKLIAGGIALLVTLGGVITAIAKSSSNTEEDEDAEFMKELGLNDDPVIDEEQESVDAEDENDNNKNDDNDEDEEE